jgi:hypothetical protein
MAPPRDVSRETRREDKSVVALSWNNFIDHMREAWSPGQHVALIGPTGQGKSTFAIGLLQLRRWVIALDPKGEDDTLSASGYERLKTWPPPNRIRDNIAMGYPARLVVGGPSRSEEETRALRRTMADAVEAVRNEGGWTLYIDEMQVLGDRRMMGVTTAIEQLLITARTRGTSVVTSYQAPAWVPRASTRQASHVVIWGTHDQDSVKTIAEAMGRDWKELIVQVRELPDFHVLSIPKRYRDPLILTHPPKVG